MNPDDTYPRYTSVFQNFRTAFSKFDAFIKSNSLGAIEPLQYEITYVNHILQGKGWTTLNDIGCIFPDFTWRAETPRFLPEMEAVNWRTSFLLPNHLGRLHVTIRSAVRRTDNCPLIIVELTVRGIGNDRSLQVMWGWFDVAHELIVHGFTDLTSEKTQKEIWRRIP